MYVQKTVQKWMFLEEVFNVTTTNLLNFFTPLTSMLQKPCKVAVVRIEDVNFFGNNQAQILQCVDDDCKRDPWGRDVVRGCLTPTFFTCRYFVGISANFIWYPAMRKKYKFSDAGSASEEGYFGM